MNQRDIALPENPPKTAARAEPRTFSAATDCEASRRLTLGLVHEMNNVLGGIAVLTELYQGGSGTDEGLGEGLTLVHKGTGRLQTLVSHLQALNEPPIEEAVYLNLSETVRAMLEMFAPLLPKTVVVETAFPPEELAVHLAEAVFRRVLLNLTLNLRDVLGDTKTLRVEIRHLDGSVKLTLSVDAASDRNLSADALARLDDARQCLHGMGGTLTARSTHEFILELPLVL